MNTFVLATRPASCDEVAGKLSEHIEFPELDNIEEIEDKIRSLKKKADDIKTVSIIINIIYMHTFCTN